MFGSQTLMQRIVLSKCFEEKVSLDDYIYYYFIILGSLCVKYFFWEILCIFDLNRYQQICFLIKLIFQLIKHIDFPKLSAEGGASHFPEAAISSVQLKLYNQHENLEFVIANSLTTFVTRFIKESRKTGGSFFQWQCPQQGQGVRGVPLRKKNFFLFVAVEKLIKFYLRRHIQIIIY